MISSVPVPPPSSTSFALVLDGWIHLPRPAELTPSDFEQALKDLETQRKLEWKTIRNHVYVRWLS